MACRSAPGKHSDTKNLELSVSSKEVNQLSEQPGNTEYSLFTVLGSNSKPLQITVPVEGYKLTMEIDTGAAVSIVSKDTVNNSPFLKCLPLQQVDVNLHTYIGQSVSILGQLLVKVQLDEVQETIPLQMVKGGGTTLLGRDWLQKF